MPKSKFFLNTLKKKSLRFEVIYKNILRDMRKFFTTAFCDYGNFFETRNSNDNSLAYINAIRSFLKCSPLFNLECLSKINLSEDDLIF